MSEKRVPTAREIAEAKNHPGDEWVPGSTIDQIEGLDRENFAYRWVQKDVARIKRFLAEGWTFVNELDGDKVLHRKATTGALDAGSRLDTSVDHRDVVMMKLPRERAEARRRYYQKKTDKAVELINRDAQNAARNLGGEINPQVRIQSGGNVTVID
jgi:hypothetical protein